ncbi:MAG: Ti-type conjugative transfer relaxase TraA [Pseudanabaena sp. M57BS1SP1A06MG]|nr:Ti-type conjugative transfer relaxase TraA [Pseudanabaena sp. M57BS1SP1A06MG]
MAIYHFSGTVISRSQGRSATACAAYRSGERLYDERYVKTHDYTKKQDIGHVEILLPKDAPAWMSDRQTLWNAVEACEKRKDAQLAREFNFSLPRELTLEQNILLAKEFVKTQFVDKGMVADLSVHNDKTPSGELQPHAHVMLTLREVTPDGFGQKIREWNAKENLLLWREAWAEVANQHLFLQGHDQRIDHRSLKEQGIELEPQHKIGAVVAQEKLARLADHQRIARENGEKILADPRIALDALTRQQSTFTHQDLARFINRYTETPEQFQQVYETVKHHPEIAYLGLDDKHCERFTTQNMLAVEQRLLRYAEELPQNSTHAVSLSHQAVALRSRSLTDEQQLAFSHITRAQQLSCLVGYAGTGKSYLLGAAREAWEAEGYRVVGATLSGIAAENLEASSGIESRTLASHCYYWDKGEQRLSSRDVLVIDEAGMVGSRQMSRILDEAAQCGTKVVLIGDPEQLQAIEAGAAFRAISERTGYVELTEVRRQQLNWQKEATLELATGQTEQALSRYDQHQHVHACDQQTEAKQGLIALWNDTRLSQPDKTQMMLAYTRADVRELNEMARHLRSQQQELGENHTLPTDRGLRDFAEQDRVYFLKNDRSLGVKNGTLGTVERIDGPTLTVRLDRDEQSQQPVRTVTFDLARYNHLDHGYAATIHKAQGVTVDRSYVLTSKTMDRHVTYVAASRHRESCDLFYSRELFADQQALASSLSRERAKDTSLDYTLSSHVSTISEKAPTEFQQAFKNDQPIDKNYDQFLTDAAKDYEKLLSEKTPSIDDDFKHFIAEFEKQNPEQAKALQEPILPRHERMALETEKHIKSLEKEIQTSKFPHMIREQLEKYACDVAKKSDVMAYFKEHNKSLCDKIQHLAKARERDMERDIGL